jgi:hypothetical protein
MKVNLSRSALVVSVAGLRVNKKALDFACMALKASRKKLESSALSQLVQLHREGSTVTATVQCSAGTVTLPDCLQNWSCCSCNSAIQLRLCCHHVLALMAAFPRVPSKDFGDLLLQTAGRRFGAENCCHRGLGGMHPLSHKLEELDAAAEKRAASVQPAVSVPQASHTTLPFVSVGITNLVQLQEWKQDVAPHNIGQEQQPASRVPSLTPSKRSALSGGEDLKRKLDGVLATLCGDSLPDQERRIIYKSLLVGLQHAEDRAQNHKDGEIAPSVAFGERFEAKACHVYRPQFSPGRHRSAAEQSTMSGGRGGNARKDALMEAQLMVGEGNKFIPTATKQHQNHRKPARTMSERVHKTCQSMIESAKRTSEKMMGGASE